MVTRRSWIRSLVALACGAFAVKRSIAHAGFDLASGKDRSVKHHWKVVSASSGNDVVASALPRPGDPYPSQPPFWCRIDYALGDTPLWLGGERITDDMVYHAEWHCEAVPTGVACHGGSWSKTYRAGDVMTGSLMLNDNRCLSILAHRENDAWRVEQCVCTNLHLLQLTTTTRFV